VGRTDRRKDIVFYIYVHLRQWTIIIICVYSVINSAGCFHAWIGSQSFLTDLREYELVNNYLEL
jgi:hypothetical protein